MSDHVELVRAGCEAYIAGDLERSLSYAAPDIEWDLSEGGVWIEQPVYRGRDGVRRFWDDWLAIWDSYEMTVEEVVDAGPSAVVTVMRQAATARASGAQVEMRFAQLWSVHGGQIERMRMFQTREQALEALEQERAGAG